MKQTTDRVLRFAREQVREMIFDHVHVLFDDPDCQWVRPTLLRMKRVADDLGVDYRVEVTTAIREHAKYLQDRGWKQVPQKVPGMEPDRIRPEPHSINLMKSNT